MFLLLGVSGGLAGKIEVPAQRQNIAAILGGVLLAVGLVLYFVPAHETGSKPSASTLSAPPPGSAATAPKQPPSAAPDMGGAARQAPGKEKKELIDEARSWPLVVRDSLESNNTGWSLGDYQYSEKDSQQKGTRSLSDGAYRWSAQFIKRGLIYEHPLIDPVSDFYLSVEARMNSVPNEGAAYGLTFRRSGPNLYYFVVANTGDFLLARDMDGATKVLLPWTRAKSIKPQAVNRIVIIAVGEQFSFYINDQPVALFSDASMRSGNVGLTIEGHIDGARATVDFDNFELRRKP
ncbi:MAG: hypothetical protein HYS61_02945 [Acidobacteria bacterium]|nr:hypothetical protein [Acidobacteriota bacterium]